MSRREHDTASRPSSAKDFRPESPFNSHTHTYASPYADRPIVYTYPRVLTIPPPSSILPANGPPSHLATANTKVSGPTPAAPAKTSLSKTDAPHREREISPPPLRRSQTRPGPQASTGNTSSTPMAPPQDSPKHHTQTTTLPSRASRPSNGSVQWNKQDLAKVLQGKLVDVRKDHSSLVTQVIEATTPTELRTHHGMDLFANLRDGAVPERKGDTMRVKFKQHLKTRKDQREEHHNIIPIKTTKERVPRYRFHHVQISSNVLTPNTMLTFVPHLRDLEGSEETKYNLWLKELEDIDLKSGFKPMNREEKVILTIQTERAATISLYLDTWLEAVNIPNCTKSALIAYMATQESDENITPQKKTDIIRSNREADGDPTGLDSTKAAALFTDAFHLAFEDNLPLASKIELRRILALDESVDGVLDPKPIAKDAAVTQQGDEDETAEARLATYSILGCLICFSHSCDHGEYDIKNLKRTFSVSSVTPLAELLRQRRRRYVAAGKVGMQHGLPCRNQCYRLSPPVGQMREAKAWIEDEHVLLRSIFLTTSQSILQQDPICYVAEILDRECSDVYAKFKSLSFKIPEALQPEPPRLKPLSWFDNRKKILIGDWQDHTITHEHQRREVLEPCSHEGSCTPQNCTCVKAGILCEKWCKCTAETCAYKFTGCGCHSTGKCCQSKQKEKPCLCVQLNRECDPILCGTCGALERCDPLNARDEQLHETGCQNSELQRGLSRELVLGQSQLDGVGYGLFTAEAIAQDDFVVEYVGELITHDEGVRREARRGDVFDEESNISYVFTLLENEGIWVDAAIYGNLSRYINHASEHDSTGSNITPRILYVNGEYRIKFTAMRDIKAGEELFFNYGENFPNLTKKLLDTKAGQKPDGSRRPGQPGQTSSRKGVARKAPKPDLKKMEQKKPIVKRRKRRTIVKEDVGEINSARPTQTSPLSRPVKRKRGLERDHSDDETYYARRSATHNQWQESTAEEDDGLADELMTPTDGIQTRRSLRARMSETPTKSDKAKAAGRRGGARPGSGRPRKQPRSVPKSLDGTRATRGSRELPANGSWRESLSESPGARGKPRGVYDDNDNGEEEDDDPEGGEIQDSQEWSTAAEEEDMGNFGDYSQEEELDGQVEGGREGNGEEQFQEYGDEDGDELQQEEEEAEAEMEEQMEEYYDQEDGEENGEELEEELDEDEGEQEEDEEDDEEEDDQDVVVRKRMDRATRNRRPPAKFRGDDFF